MPLQSLIFLCFLLLATIPSCMISVAQAAPQKKASLLPLWSPQAQFAGYYVALDKGMYARHGMDLTIRKGGPGHSPAESLQNGEADFAIMWLTTALHHRSAGTKLVNIFQVIPKSSMMLVSRKSSGIRKIEDMQGKKVGLWRGDLSIPPHTLFAKRGIKVQEIPQSGTVNLFLRGGVDVTSAMWYNEYHVLLSSGVDPNQLNAVFLQDEGMNFPEDGLYALEATVNKDPALVAAFVDASREGWQYAFAHPEEALDIVIRYMRQAQLPANRMHQKWMLERMRDLMIGGRNQAPIGTLARQDYETVGKAMQHEGVISNYPDYATFTWRDNAGK
jgi:NitT/TauT family transport system substrate-binding protein